MIASNKSATSLAPLFARAAVLAAAVAAVYANSFAGVFVFDDNAVIVDNPAIHRFEPLTIARSSGSRPLLNLSLAVNYALGGLDPFGYHLVNVAVHLVAVWLLFAVVRATLRSPRLDAVYGDFADNLAFVAALLWAVHPLNTQAVTYIVQRCESMMAAAFLAVLWCLAQARVSPRPWGWRCGAAFALAVSVASKEVGLMAIPVGWLYDWSYFHAGDGVPQPPMTWRRRWLAVTAACGLLATGLWWIKPVLLEDGSAGFGTIAVTPGQYFRSQPGVIAHYLSLVAWPNPLCLDYGWPVENRWIVGVALPAIGVGGLFVASVILAWRRSAAGFPGVAFFLILAPTSSIVPIQDLAFEHRMYLPAALVIATAVVAFHTGIRRCTANSIATRDDDQRSGTLPQAVVVAISIAFLACAATLGLATVQRNRDYHSAAGMWRDVLVKVLRRGRPATHLHRVTANLGLELHKEGRTDEALEVFEEGLRIAPQSTAIHANYAQALIDLERFEEAANHLSQVLKVEPRTPHFVHQAALVAIRAGRMDEAETLFRRAIESEPRTATFRVNLARLLEERERRDEAINQLTLAAGLYGASDP
ncbi:MAG: tetratricopeptide repeat protein, partial [Planctomycetota bacterium]